VKDSTADLRTAVAFDKLIAERDAARADNLRLRELLFDVRCCPIEHVARSYVTVQIDRPTWDALHAIDARTEQVPL